MIDPTINVDIARTVNNKQSNKNSRLKNGIIGAIGGAGVSGAVLAGDKYCPNATTKIIHILNFSLPPKETIVKPVFEDFSIRTKCIGVAAIALLTGALSAIISPHRKDN